MKYFAYLLGTLLVANTVVIILSHVLSLRSEHSFILFFLNGLFAPGLVRKILNNDAKV